MTRSTWAMVILAVCLATTVAAIAYAAGKTSVPEVIRAQRFEVVDAEGRMRIQLCMSADGQAPGLSLFDDEGVRQATLGLLADGRSGLLFADQNGKPRASLACSADGSPALALCDDTGEPRASLSLSSEGSSNMLKVSSARRTIAAGNL